MPRIKTSTTLYYRASTYTRVPRHRETPHLFVEHAVAAVNFVHSRLVVAGAPLRDGFQSGCRVPLERHALGACIATWEESVTLLAEHCRNSSVVAGHSYCDAGQHGQGDKQSGQVPDEYGDKPGIPRDPLVLDASFGGVLAAGTVAAPEVAVAAEELAAALPCEPLPEAHTAFFAFLDPRDRGRYGAVGCTVWRELGQEAPVGADRDQIAPGAVAGTLVAQLTEVSVAAGSNLPVL